MVLLHWTCSPLSIYMWGFLPSIAQEISVFRNSNSKKNLLKNEKNRKVLYKSPARIKALQITLRYYWFEGIHWIPMECENRRHWHTESKGRVIVLKIRTGTGRQEQSRSNQLTLHITITIISLFLAYLPLMVIVVNKRYILMHILCMVYLIQIV